MTLVLGSVLIRDGSLTEALAVSQEHVERSRGEPGCLEHGVSVDAQVPRRLVFVERWASMDALRTHFVVPASRGFAKRLGALAAQPPSMAVYDANELPVGGQGGGAASH
jgi:quinol monooxygenase YgiN